MARVKPEAIGSGETKKRVQRFWRRRRKETIETVAQADQTIEKLLIRRFDRLGNVKRFTALWVGLFIFLIAASFWQARGLSPYYQKLEPVPGGLYSEGLVGSFTNASPLYATGAADSAVSRLIFSGLFGYNDKNVLVGDLATGYDLSSAQTTYTVHLRHGVMWQDGKPFTSADVVFTYQTIQNIEAESPLYSSWQGIDIRALDKYTVAFTLPDPLSSFPYSLTNGIVPMHLLAKVPPQQLRSSLFNITRPVGTGPFELKYIEVGGNDTSTRSQRISFAAFKKYWAGSPKLDGVSLLTFSDQSQLISAFAKKQLNGISGLDSVPAGLNNDKSVRIYNTPLTTAVMAFFNTSKPIFSDARVRQALVSSVDTPRLEKAFAYPVKLVNEPFLPGQLGYDPAKPQLAYNPAHAAKQLDAAGWRLGPDGLRSKGGQPLSFELVTSQEDNQYVLAAQFLQKAWGALGVKVVINYPPSSDDLQSLVANHDYDCLLYGINIGVDPDVFAYWDSSQASVTSQGHSNLSEYRSAAANQALEAGRTRADPGLRAIKYQAFLAAWRNDAPALALYQPNFLYITRGPVYNYQRSADNLAIDRFYNIAHWEIRRQAKTIN